MKKLMIAVVSLATALTSLPAMAAPAFVARPMGQMTTSAPDATFQTVGCNNLTNCPQENPRWTNGHRRWDRDRDYRWDRRDYRSDRRYYRDRDRRHHSNAGAVIGGLAAGAVIGGIIASQQQGSRTVSGSHEQYCASKYRSYRAYDNTYQPLSGPRQQCR
ncbi:uncharacterized protein YcfJ [Neorhizobium galegae]|uniref:BA14K family protein n=1 Tax=Neorhizobium galegae TaxID=399 RepID=UPI001AE1C668|nr:BA14K family protein [Neorhizobium galegae]MBP2549460.1 uncharacterized protein YcfJ [Neorhizobium galegae]